MNIKQRRYRAKSVATVVQSSSNSNKSHELTKEELKEEEEDSVRPDPTKGLRSSFRLFSVTKGSTTVPQLQHSV